MKSPLKEYKIRIEAVGPVFIGSGEDISKKEYIAERKAYIPNRRKMFAALIKMHKIDAFEKYMADNQKYDLGGWLREQRISPKEYMSWIDYEMDFRDVDFNAAGTGRRGNRSRKLQLFIKDAYGKPYVPGSSVKGMFRTILLADDIISNPDKYIENMNEINEAIGKNNKGLRENVDSLEAKAFRLLEKPNKSADDALNDVMSAIRFSDSKPLDVSDLIVCQKVDMKPDGKITKFPVVRECLKPGTVIECTMMVDESAIKGKFDISPNRIERAIRNFARIYSTYFREKFSAEYLPASSKAIDAAAVYLGGGAGFASKTVVYPMYKKDGYKTAHDIFKVCLYNSNPKKNLYNVHKHIRDIREYKVSPHICKITYYKDKPYEMGKCLVYVE